MEIDAVVTDIDGVLVDTSDSYHRAIVESVRSVYGETIERSQTQEFKDAGGFNNDWLTTDAIALYILAQRNGFDGDVIEFTEAIAERGGGLEAAQAVVEDVLADEAWDVVRDAWNPRELRRTFQWLYLGPERYGDLEDDAPPEKIPSSAGFMDDEPVILDANTRTFLSSAYPLGVHTGRPRAEAEIALERVGLRPQADRVITMDDWDGGKPDPDGLIRIANAVEATRVVYVGDELDDMRTATNATDSDDRTFIGIGVMTGGLHGESGVEALIDAGATAVIDSINDLPNYLERGGEPLAGNTAV